MKFDRDPTKRYVRHAMTGDLGVVVQKDGKTKVQMRDSLIDYRESDWYDETQPQNLTLLQCAEIAFAADQRLLYYLGEHARAKKQWISLTPEDRVKFAEEGPKDSTDRRLLWRVIMRATESLRKVA